MNGLLLDPHVHSRYSSRLTFPITVEFVGYQYQPYRLGMDYK